MLVLYALVMPAVLLICGLALDVGVLELTKLRMQTAADAAALAAQLEAERGTGNWVSMAQQDAALNGFTNGANNVTVTAYSQPSYGDYQGRYDFLEVDISQNVSTVFMWTFNGSPVTVTASAVSQMTPCAYFFGGGSGAMSAYGMDVYTGSVIGNTCPVYASYGFNIESAGALAVEAMNSAGSSANSSQAGYVWPTPFFNSATISDPLSWETQPTYTGSCNHTNYSLSNGTASLSPGTYCNGLNLTNSTVTLSPGLYIITGGATWNGSQVSGTGVTLFFTKGGASSYGQFIAQLDTSITLSAPTDSSNGGIPGILFFADRNWVNTSPQDFRLSACYYYGDGIWYIKGAGMYWNTCGYVTAPNYFGIVADNLWTNGNLFQFMNNYSGVSTGNPFLNSGQPLGGLVQ